MWLDLKEDWPYDTLITTLQAYFHNVICDSGAVPCSLMTYVTFVRNWLFVDMVTFSCLHYLIFSYFDKVSVSHMTNVLTCNWILHF